ncbi:hypothetical protein GCM10010399_63530 [Dactylosporangium fulvum]|uniref:Rho termination factor N-terminal domain-containing protein n=1 Tax=Dactylosporangium fulvum TaxID=53359 RepID=A0ABY5VQU6_9ACTN|nr:DUF6582 domain-containing protein [Dactylosporangium fulvum]UWP79542.1 hypothetical protein Dfulv_30795 [Dactylosporangium fulvum]
MATRKQTSNQLDAGERDELSDSAYAFPRVRKEPLNDASHVRNAIARFDQVRDVSDEERREAFRRIKRAAGKYGVEMSADRWQDLGKPSATMKSSDKPRTPTKGGRAANRRADRSRDELYAEAKRRNIKGRSGMTKAELHRALS